MSTTQPNINQFGISSVQGQIDLLGTPSNVITCQVDSSQATALAQGAPVKLSTTAGGVPKVVGLAANTDVTFGFIARNVKDQTYAANSYCEVALINTVMQMTSGAAITRGAKLEVVYTTNKVITNAGTNPVVGFALDTATGADQLIRVYIITQSYQSAQTIADIAGLEDDLDARIEGINNTVLLAEVNAGKVLVAVPTGKKAIVTNFVARCNGAFAVGTSIDLLVGATNVASIAQAQATNGAILIPGSAGVTLGAGFGIAGASGDDITVGKTGSSFTTATDIKYTVSYYLIDA
jgi:hypothetical protein